AGPVPDSLATALIPSLEPGSVISEQTVRRILACIGLGPGDTAAWVAPDGRWRLGPLHGSWAQPAPGYLGRASRGEARRRRLAELGGLIGALDARIEAARSTAEAAERRQAELVAELAREPQDQELRDAHSRVTGATGELRRAQDRVERLITDVGFKR